MIQKKNNTICLSVQNLIQNTIYKAGKKVSMPAEQALVIETSGNRTLAFGNQYYDPILSRTPRSLEKDNSHLENIITDASSGSSDFHLYL